MQTPVCRFQGRKPTGAMVDTTSSVADELAMLPLELLTTTLYDALSPTWALSKTSRAFIAPGIGALFLNHW